MTSRDKTRKKQRTARVRRDQRRKDERVAAEPETPADPADFPGIVISSHGYMAEIAFADGRRRMCHLQIKGRPRVVVGDRVAVNDLDAEYPVAFALMPRRTVLNRPGGEGKDKVVAANVECLAVVSAVEPPFRPGLVDRYIVAARAAGIEPVLVLNKIDLHGADAARGALMEFETLGYRTVCTSAVSGEGLDELAGMLKGAESAFVGHSGVGKSSLINRIVPGVELETGALSGASGKGRHVTSVSTLHILDGGGFIVDSPGIRVFGVRELDAAEVRNHFVEFGPYEENCRFDDCLHRVEEGCAVIEAVERGEISARRHKSYLRILESIETGEWD